jgi:hypothetical protein
MLRLNKRLNSYFSARTQATARQLGTRGTGLERELIEFIWKFEPSLQWQLAENKG